jgi:hypothetical protein
MQLLRERKREKEKNRTKRKKKQKRKQTIKEGHIFLLVKRRAWFRFTSRICNAKACFYLAVT